MFFKLKPKGSSSCWCPTVRLVVLCILVSSVAGVWCQRACRWTVTYGACARPSRPYWGAFLDSHDFMSTARCTTIWIVQTGLFFKCVPNYLYIYMYLYIHISYTYIFVLFYRKPQACKLQKNLFFQKKQCVPNALSCIQWSNQLQKMLFRCIFWICLLSKVSFFTQPLNGWRFISCFFSKVGLPTMWNSGR